jgi:hypothetical protein
MAQLSLPPWLDLYDSSKHDIVSSTMNTTLNGKLYAKLLTCLEGQVLQNMVSQKHLRGNGILLLKDLSQTYHPISVPEIIAAKTGEFWTQLKRFPNESVDNYYNRFHELLDDLSEAEEPISTKSVIRHFLFTLGAEFKTIQHNYRIGNLPPEWNTQDWPTLLVLCRNYSNSVNPLGLNKRETTPKNPANTGDRAHHHKKVRQWSLNPVRYKSEIEAEQKKHEGKCIYHLTDTHLTAQCSIKKEGDRIIAQCNTTSNASTTSQSSGQLCNIKEDVVDEEVSEELPELLPDTEVNNTNNADLYYFVRMKNHFRCLVRSSTSTRHAMQYPIIADSGANFHMFREREFFKSITPTKGRVKMGDGTTTLDVLGIGTV